MHDETGCFLLKNKTECDNIQESRPSFQLRGKRKQLWALLGQHGLPWALWIPTPIKEVVNSEQASG